MASGVSSMELRVLEHPPQLWHNSQLSTSAQILLSMIIDNWQLLPTINLLASKIRSLNSVFPSSLGLKLPSLSASYLQECVNEGRGYKFARALRARSTEHLPPSNSGYATDGCVFENNSALNKGGVFELLELGYTFH